MKSEICIISCGAKKIFDTSPEIKQTQAKLAYTGPLFKKCKEFAEMFFPGNWFIISDKYGLIHPDMIIKDYNIPPSAIKGDIKFLQFVKSQSKSLKLSPISIITTSGQIHESVIRAVFTNSKITNPLSGLGQGKRMQKLNELMEVNK